MLLPYFFRGARWSDIHIYICIKPCLFMKVLSIYSLASIWFTFSSVHYCPMLALFFFLFIQDMLGLVCMAVHNLTSSLAVRNIFCLCSWMKRKPFAEPRAWMLLGKLKGPWINLWLTSRSLSEKTCFFLSANSLILPFFFAHLSHCRYWAV